MNEWIDNEVGSHEFPPPPNRNGDITRVKTLFDIAAIVVAMYGILKCVEFILGGKWPFIIGMFGIGGSYVLGHVLHHIGCWKASEIDQQHQNDLYKWRHKVSTQHTLHKHSVVREETKSAAKKEIARKRRVETSKKQIAKSILASADIPLVRFSQPEQWLACIEVPLHHWAQRGAVVKNLLEAKLGLHVSVLTFRYCDKCGSKLVGPDSTATVCPTEGCGRILEPVTIVKPPSPVPARVPASVVTQSPPPVPARAPESTPRPAVVVQRVVRRKTAEIKQAAAQQTVETPAEQVVAQTPHVAVETARTPEPVTRTVEVVAPSQQVIPTVKVVLPSETATQIEEAAATPESTDPKMEMTAAPSSTAHEPDEDAESESEGSKADEVDSSEPAAPENEMAKSPEIIESRIEEAKLPESVPQRISEVIVQPEPETSHAMTEPTPSEPERRSGVSAPTVASTEQEVPDQTTGPVEMSNTVSPVLGDKGASQQAPVKEAKAIDPAILQWHRDKVSQSVHRERKEPIRSSAPAYKSSGAPNRRAAPRLIEVARTATSTTDSKRAEDEQLAARWEETITAATAKMNKESDPKMVSAKDSSVNGMELPTKSSVADTVKPEQKDDPAAISVGSVVRVVEGPFKGTDEKPVVGRVEFVHRKEHKIKLCLLDSQAHISIPVGFVAVLETKTEVQTR